MVRKTVIRCHSEGIGITFSAVSSHFFSANVFLYLLHQQILK